VISDLGQ
jgi:putative flippase GtrA